MKNKLSISGKTTDGKLVVKGTYQFQETTGLPLVDIISKIKSENMSLCWIDYYQSALDAGMKSKNVMERIGVNCQDAFGLEYKTIVIKTLKKLVELKEI